jgi:hypothetical protein
MSCGESAFAGGRSDAQLEDLSVLDAFDHDDSVGGRDQRPDDARSRRGRKRGERETRGL